jgi:hypothetical protein
MLVISTVDWPATPPFEEFNFGATVLDFYAEVGPEIANQLRNKAPRGSGPTAGRLASSIYFTAEQTQSAETAGTVYALEFKSDVPEAAFVLGGTSAHEIVPVSVLALHWQTMEGEDIFAARVSHPGTLANPFPVQVAEDNVDSLPTLLLAKIIELISEGFTT